MGSGIDWSKSIWNTYDYELFKLWNLFAEAHIRVPDVPQDLYDLLMIPSEERFRLMLPLFHGIYSEMSFWGEAEAVQETHDSESNEMESYMIKFWKVCQWFGLANDESIVRGTAASKDQYDFWLRITDQNVDKPPQESIYKTRLFEEITIMNTSVLDFIRREDGSNLIGMEEACAIINGITEETESATEKLNQRITKQQKSEAKEVLAKFNDPAFQNSLKTIGKDLKEFLSTQKLETPSSSDNSLLKKSSEGLLHVNELEDAVNLMEKIILDVSKNNKDLPEGK